MNPNVVPFLSSDNLGSDLQLARKIYLDNASTSFRQQARYVNSPLPFIDRRSIQNAASFRFYMFGDTPAPEREYQSGGELRGQDYALKEGDVNLDEIIVHDHVIGRRDQAISHINMAPLFGKENGRQVAVDLDRRILNQLGICGRQAAVTKGGRTIHNGGIRVTRNSGLGGSPTVAAALAAAYPLNATGAANLRADLRLGGYLCDSAFWPEDQRWLIMDAYLRQVLMYDAVPGTLFSKDYQEQNSILNRNVMLIDGWRVYAWEKRVDQGGLMPSENVTYFTKSTKFNNNFMPGASTGYPAVIGFVAAGEDQAAVGFGESIAITSAVHDPNVTLNHTWLYETYCLCAIEKERPYSAFSIEVLN